MIAVAAGTIAAITVYFLLRHGPRWAGIYLLLASLQQVLFFAARQYWAAGFFLGLFATYLILGQRRHRDRRPRPPDDRGAD